MSYLLHINTALEKAHIGLSDGEKVIAARESAVQKEHGSFLQPAIKEICDESGISLNKIAAVSVVNGPGSYTGLRVGLAAAKGICFALDKPLICLSTLEWLAHPFSIYDEYHMPNDRRPEDGNIHCHVRSSILNLVTPPMP
jgi:tRNA threonylcarbamoyladenosine biosynthesis protein TsaB